jgi:hypothetical protein
MNALLTNVHSPLELRPESQDRTCRTGSHAGTFEAAP